MAKNTQSTPAGAGSVDEDFIPVLTPKNLRVDRLPARRIALGQLDDQKPSLVLLPDGQLLLTAFNISRKHDGKIQIDNLLFRSHDDGLTWSRREVMDLPGVELYFTVTSDGTVFATANHLTADISNQDGLNYSLLHRSDDKGATWATLRITAEDISGAPPETFVGLSRNVLELADGTLVMGVSEDNGGADFLWQSRDGGGTWEKDLRCEFEGVDKATTTCGHWCPFFGEAILWQANCGDILGLFRVYPPQFEPLPNDGDYRRGYVKELDDQHDRLLVFRTSDGGRSWRREKELGSYYGEMFPSILRLQDGRLLLTFTVRSLHPPLGVHAVLGEETPDGFSFDFASDRMVIDSKTPLDQISGGGFGPTVQIDDGTLITAYSYRGSSELMQLDSFIVQKQQLEVVRWHLPPQ